MAKRRVPGATAVVESSRWGGEAGREARGPVGARTRGSVGTKAEHREVASRAAKLPGEELKMRRGQRAALRPSSRTLLMAMGQPSPSAKHQQDLILAAEAAQRRPSDHERTDADGLMSRTE